MKKICIILFSALILSFVSCSGKDDFSTQNVSQLRENVFVYENDDFFAEAFAEYREKEKADDGFVGERKNFMIFRLRFKKKSFQSASIKFETDGIKYENDFGFSPSSSYVSCETEVSSFPKSSFFAALDIDGNEHTVEFVSVKNEGTLGCEKAIKECETKEKDRISEFIKDKNYEIRVRLIENGGFNFYFVGYITENSSVSFLLDGITGEVLAVKEN